MLPSASHQPKGESSMRMPLRPPTAAGSPGSDLTVDAFALIGSADGYLRAARRREASASTSPRTGATVTSPRCPSRSDAWKEIHANHAVAPV